MPRITFEGKRYPIAEGETVLAALLRGGATIPFSCRKGTCQSCMMRAREGDPGVLAQTGLRDALREQGHFLPCRSHPKTDLVIARPDPAELLVRARVHAKETIAPNVVRVLLEPETNMTWRAGQFVNLRHRDGATRSYSIASMEEDYFLELHVKRAPGGKVSTWIVDTLAPGDVVDVQGPLGACVYDAAQPDRPLLLVGVGTGLSPLLGVARDALARGHRGPIALYHGAREPEGLYDRPRMEAMARARANFQYVACVSGPRVIPGTVAGRVVDVAFEQHTDLSGWTAYLCGNPEMVYEARHRAFRAGVAREDIHSDAFEHTSPFMPDDPAKLATLAPDPELWDALDRGTKLRAVLVEFYGRVYEDPRLAPFFHKVTKERAIDKQYAFLADVFTGKREYFGLKPFNAHHWMIISDELFDYRERLLEECMRRHGLPEHLVRRWSAVHELFRREIVKSSARGMIVDGREHLLEGFREETLDIACMCDGCGSEMPAGSRGRMHARTGELFCAACGARAVGQTMQPAPIGG